MQASLNGARLLSYPRTRLGLRRLSKVRIHTPLIRKPSTYLLDSSQRSISSGQSLEDPDTPSQTTQNSCTSQTVQSSGMGLERSSMENIMYSMDGIKGWLIKWYEGNLSQDQQDENGKSQWGEIIVES